MKRSIALIIISFTLLLVISGCGMKSTVISNNGIYSIKEIDNDYYMVIDRSKANELSGTSQLASLSFDSMDHIIDALANGKFQDWELDVIYSAFPKNENGIKIFDYNHVYLPVVPRGFSSQCVSWSGENYTYLYDARDGSSVNVAICTDESYNSTIKREYYDFFDRKTIALDEIVEQEEKTIYYYSTSMGEFKEVRYSFENNGARYIVNESYRLKYYGSTNLKVSDSVPSQVSLYVEKIDDDQKAIITIFDLTYPMNYTDFAISDKK